MHGDSRHDLAVTIMTEDAKTEENTAGGPCGAYIGLAGKFGAELSNTQRHTEANTSIFSRLRQHLNEP